MPASPAAPSFAPLQARIQVVTSAALLLLFGFLVAVVVRAFLDKSRLNDWTSSPGTEQELLLYAVALVSPAGAAAAGASLTSLAALRGAVRGYRRSHHWHHACRRGRQHAGE